MPLLSAEGSARPGREGRRPHGGGGIIRRDALLCMGGAESAVSLGAEGLRLQEQLPLLELEERSSYSKSCEGSCSSRWRAAHLVEEESCPRGAGCRSSCPCWSWRRAAPPAPERASPPPQRRHT